MEPAIDTPARPQTVSHYTVLKKLGAGGMGEVYLAEDVVLNRKVAIKFLPPDSVADPQANRRLIREAQAAAKLVHPNICTIYEASEAAGCGFIVMELVEGETLASRIKNNPLDLSECLEIAVQIADALTEAHSQAITHRDIKPQNIMLTGHHQAKVIDFGLAGVVRDTSRIDSEAKTERLLISTDRIMGTLAYMSPEQIRRKTVDARSDIFSFGVVLYEMITGHQPFAADNASMTIAGIVSQETPPLSDYVSDVPTELERIVRKTLRKNREERYQTSRDLLVDLKALKHHVELEKEMDGFQRAFPSNTRDSGNRARTRTATQEAKTTPHYAALVRRYGAGLIVAGSIMVLAIVTVILQRNFFATKKPFDTIAVLPLQNVGNDPELEYLSDGVADSLINSLSQLPQLRVVARPTAFRYKGKEIDPQQIGRDLQVQAIITGKLTQRDDVLTIQVDIVETNKGSQIWGRRYDRKRSDLLALRQDLAADITEKLRLSVGTEDEKRLRTGDTRNPDAYQFYLRGLYFWNKQTAEDLKKAIIEFQAAVDRDPDYALAYVGLADCYTLLEPFAGEPASGLIPKASAALDRALQIDKNLAEAHTSLAFIALWSWNFSKAENEFRRAIELKPNYATGHQFYSFFLSRVRGKFNEALAEMKLAQQLDRISPRMGTGIAQIYVGLGQLDASIEELKKVIEFDPNYAEAHRFLGIVYRKQRRYEEAIKELETAVKLSEGEGWTLSDLAVCYAVSGKKAQAQSLLNDIEEKYDKREALGQELAYVHAALGQKEQAFTWLEKDFQVRSGSLFLIAYSPRGDILRETLSSDPRWNDLLRRIGLP